MLPLLNFFNRLWSRCDRWRFGVLALLSAILCIVATPTYSQSAGINLRQEISVAEAARSQESESSDLLTRPENKTFWLTQLPQQSASTQQLMQQGREQYTSGEYAAAVITWQQVAQLFANQRQGANAASALSNQGLAHLQLGQYDEAQTAITAAREWLQTLSNDDYSRRILAQVLNTEGQFYMAQGHAVNALTALQQAAEEYATLGDPAGQIRAQLNQMQILRVQGQLKALGQIQEDIAAQIESLEDSGLKAIGLRLLGLSLQQSGDLEAATEKLQASREVAANIDSATHLSEALLNLGNVSEGEAALEYYRQAAEIAPTALARSRAEVNALAVEFKLGDLTTIMQKLPGLFAQVSELPPSRAAFFVRINLVNQLLQPDRFEANQPLLPTADIATLLTNTVDQAKTLGDGQGQTYGLGYQGRLYELDGQIEEAIQRTQAALVISQSIHANEADYKWQWQLGRLFEAQDQTDDAISAYQQALATLQRLRGDLVAADRETQFSFREGIEPVYRDLVDLLLKTTPEDTEQANLNLFEVRNVIESLQVEELVNFFRADCVVTRPTQIDQIDSKAAVIYPIILDDRIEVIIGLPDQPLQRKSIIVPKATVDATLDELLTNINYPPAAFDSAPDSETVTLGVFAADPNVHREPAQQVYDWLIRPSEAILRASGVDTLAFVLDGKLRNVPMSVLYDGTQYLVEQYAIALTPGLQLLDPQPLAARQVEALAGGLSEGREGFSPLPFVEDELKAIEDQVPSQILLDETFKTEEFRGKLTSTAFPVVHLATHGEFGARLEDTFILTWDGKLDANQLSAFLQNSEISRDGTVELLVLSACETATGDDRAALGLAGIAVRSGARSTLATLWQVNDEGTSVLMGDLYKLLSETKQTKAQVLRQAQLNMLTSDNARYHHPYFWAPFVLVGNWL